MTYNNESEQGINLVVMVCAEEWMRKSSICFFIQKHIELFCFHSSMPATMFIMATVT